MAIIGTVGDAWATVADRVRTRPLPFLVAAALLTGTDLLQWKIGLLDGVRGADADRGLLALFLVTKLLATLGWLLASIRLAADPAAGRLLRLGKRQILWLGALLLLMPVALMARLVLQKLVGTALAPIDPDPRTVLLLGIVAYLALFLYVQVRLMPGLIGVLLGDSEASLRWAWRGTRGLAFTFVASLLIAVLPSFALHFSNALVWLPQAFAPRLAVLAFDGAVMAALLFTGSAIYVGLYRKAKAAGQAEAGPVVLAAG
jgi:hypothetical protein